MSQTGKWLSDVYAYLGGFPDSYMVCDVETNGKDPYSDKTLITQLGYFLYVPGVLEEQWSAVLDWTRDDLNVDQDWLKESLDETRRAMERRGRTYHTTYDRMRAADSLHPRDAFHVYSLILKHALETGMAFVGHNLWAFDRPLIERDILRYADYEFQFPGDRTIDTGMVEKAVQMRAARPQSFLPAPQWYRNIADTRSRVRWSLDGHCVKHYGLDEKYSIDPDKAHDAGFDCWVTHLLLTAHKDLAGVSQNGKAEHHQGSSDLRGAVPDQAR